MFRKLAGVVFLLFLISISYFSHGQIDTLRWHEGIRLQRSDFMHRNGPAYVDVMFGYKYSFQRSVLGASIPIVITDVYLNRRTSTISDTSPFDLRYAQIVIDIEGYHSKLVKNEVYKHGKFKGSDQAMSRQMDSIFFEANAKVTMLKKELSMELMTQPVEEVIRRWEYKVADLVKQTPDIVLEEKERSLSIGSHLGMGSVLLPGKTGDYFTNGTGFSFGIEADIKRSRIAMDFVLGFNSSAADLETEGPWYTGQKTNIIALEFSYGYKFEQKKWTTVPYIGLGVTEITPRKPSDEDRRKLTGVSPAIGFEVIRNLTVVTQYPQKTKIGLKAKLSVNPNNFVSNIGGTQINMRFAVSFGSTTIKQQLVKKQKPVFM